MLDRARDLPHLVSSGLGLTSNGIHNSILRVHANRSVVLGMNDSSLPTRTLHLNRLVSGQSRVLQCNGVEAGNIFLAVRVQVRECPGCDSVEESGWWRGARNMRENREIEAIWQWEQCMLDLPYLIGYICIIKQHWVLQYYSLLLSLNCLHQLLVSCFTF